MKIVTIPLILSVALFAASGAVLAGDDGEDGFSATGIVDHVDMSTGILTLQDNEEFALGTAIRDIHLNAGDAVRVHWIPKNGVLTVDEITVLNDY